MAKLTNDENIKNLLLRKKIRTAIVVFGIITIILAVLDLVYGNWLLLGGAVLSFLISTVLTKKRESIPINKSKELDMIEDSIRKNKKK